MFKNLKENIHTEIKIEVEILELRNWKCIKLAVLSAY